MHAFFVAVFFADRTWALRVASNWLEFGLQSSLHDRVSRPVGWRAGAGTSDVSFCGGSASLPGMPL